MDRVASVGVKVALALCLVVPGRPAPSWAQVDTIFVVPGAHFDVGFDDLPSVVREHRIQAIEDALAASEADPDFHWMEDGGWGFGGWLARYRGDASRMARARRALHTGQLIISAAWVSPHGAVFGESLGLLTAHLDDMQRLLGFRPRVAVIDDAPSQPEALVDALAAHGVRYLLVGANMVLSTPLPDRLVRSPFWWESSKGARVLVYIDSGGYQPASAWLGVTDTTRFAEVVRDPGQRAMLATAERGFRRLLAESPSRYDALVFEHAGDDWRLPAVSVVPDLVRAWAAAGLRPRVVLASPLAYFRHVESRYGARLPVYRGEWGGEWDQIRAACPVWTWRLREAMRQVRPNAPVEVREALATAMDHGLTLGPGWPGKLTEQQTVAHAREQAQVFAHAVESASRVGPGRVLVSAVPKPPSLPQGRADPRWRELLADSAEVRVRVGPGQLVPFIPDRAPLLDVHVGVEAHGAKLLARARIDRHALPGCDTTITYVTLEIPLRAAAGRLRIAPANSAPARAGRWLRGAPPAFVIAPEGVRVYGLPHALRVSSPLAFSYTLVPDPERPSVTWLQVLLVRQELRCALENGTTKVLSFEDLYPGEPGMLDTWVETEVQADAMRSP